ncbi:hypothetical protein PJ267_10110 [Arthrobacter sp. OVS8]|nr:hypothetical protein PJ267_10110 [Arthrobacter sp. OVS8]
MDDLASFDSFAGLAEQPQPPTPAELVSQIATMDLLRAVISRSSPAYGGFGDHGSSLTPRSAPPRTPPQSATGWTRSTTANCGTGYRPPPESPPELFGAVDRQPALTGVGGRDLPGGWRRLHGRAGRYRPLNRGRGRLDPAAKQAALDALSDGELTALAGERLQSLGRTLRRQEQEHEQTKKIWENLG